MRVEIALERVVRPRRRLRVRTAQPRQAPFHDVLRQVEHTRHSVRVDALQQHARRGVLAVRQHHRVDHEGRGAEDVRQVLDLLHDVAVLAEVDRVLEHEHVRVDAEHLLAELLLEPARHAATDRERGDPQHHPADGEGRADGDHVSLLRSEVPERDDDRVTHASSERRGRSYHESGGPALRPHCAREAPAAQTMRSAPCGLRCFSGGGAAETDRTVSGSPSRPAEPGG